jgi:hypothetical protein
VNEASGSASGVPTAPSGNFWPAYSNAAALPPTRSSRSSLRVENKAVYGRLQRGPGAA